VQIRDGQHLPAHRPAQATGGHVFVSNDFDLNYDMFGLDQDFAGGVWQGQLSVTLLDWSATAFDGTALPTSFDLSRFGNPANASIAIRDLSNDTSVTVSGRFSTFVGDGRHPGAGNRRPGRLLCLGVAGTAGTAALRRSAAADGGNADEQCGGIRMPGPRPGWLAAAQVDGEVLGAPPHVSYLGLVTLQRLHRRHLPGPGSVRSPRPSSSSWTAV
jgi:hypothetical protein